MISPAWEEVREATETRENGLVLKLKIIPNAARTEPAGLRDSRDGRRLVLRVHAPPVDGKANAEVLRWAATWAGCALNAVQLVRGEKQREKDVWIPVVQRV